MTSQITTDAISIKGLTTGTRSVPRESLDKLAAGLVGTLVYPADEGFAEAIQLWNGMIKKQPAVVVRAADSGRRRGDRQFRA